MTPQSFDIAATQSRQMYDDPFVDNGSQDMALQAGDAFGFARQLQHLTQRGEDRPVAQAREISAETPLASLVLQPHTAAEMAQTKINLPEVHAQVALSMSDPTIGTSTWQAWLEEQVADVQPDVHGKRDAAAGDAASAPAADNLEDDACEPRLVSSSMAPPSVWAQTQQALLRSAPVAQDTSSTRASASSVSTTELPGNSPQLEAVPPQSIERDGEAAQLAAMPAEHTESATDLEPALDASFAERPSARLKETVRQASDALSGELSRNAPGPKAGAGTQASDAQNSAPTGRETSAAQQVAPAAAQDEQADWNVEAQTRLAQALPVHTSASGLLEATFADRLSDFAMLAPQEGRGDEVDAAPTQGSGWTDPARVEDGDATGEPPKLAPAKPPQTQKPEQRSADYDVDPERAEVRTQQDAWTAQHATPDAAEPAAQSDGSRRNAREGDLPAVAGQDAADSDWVAVAAQLSAGPLAPPPDSAPARTAPERAPQKATQGIEAYTQQAMQTSRDAPTRGIEAPAVDALEAPVDATAQAASKSKAAAGFAANLDEASDDVASTSTSALHPDHAAAAATRAQGLDALSASEAKPTAPTAAEGAQAAAMTATVTPARLSAQLAANLSDGARHIQLRVAPPGLGTLDIGVHLQGAQVHLTVRGDQPELTRFMQEGMHDLQKNLQQHGLDLGNTDFRGGEGSADADREPTSGNLPHNAKGPSSPTRGPRAAPRARDAHVINVLL